MLIDSGAIYSVMPPPILDRLGILPLTEQKFRLANGSRIAREKGIALFKYSERIGGADVIFGEKGDRQLLGAFTLAALGLSLAPPSQGAKGTAEDTRRYAQHGPTIAHGSSRHPGAE